MCSYKLGWFNHWAGVDVLGCWFVILAVFCNVSSSMPPFGYEPEEPNSSKTVPFLSLSNAPKQRPAREVQVFGQEPAENFTFASSATASSGHGARSVGQPSTTLRPSTTFKLFGAEEEESASHQPTKVPRRALSVFGAEAEETTHGDETCSNGVKMESDSDEAESDHDFLPRKNSVFSLGWHCVTNFQYATFWKDNINDPKSQQPKRLYDNSKRNAGAAHERKKKHSSHRQNGVNPSRLKTLFQATKCHCAISLLQVCHFLNI